jgi:Zn-dependent peptidase ImmA (M78 family)
VRARRDGDSTGAYGWFNRATKSIVVLTDALPHQQFATLVHELAHAILHGDAGLKATASSW